MNNQKVINCLLSCAYTICTWEIHCLVVITSGLDDEVPNILQEAAVPIPTNRECKQTVRPYWLILKDFHVCVGDGDPSACRVSISVSICTSCLSLAS